MVVTVKNLKTYEGDGVYIGRTNPRRKLKGSPLANNFKVKEYGREGCIQKYKEWLNQLPKTSKQWELIDELKSRHQEGEDLTLLCWCNPLPCHGDILKEIIEEASAEDVVVKVDPPYIFHIPTQMEEFNIIPLHHWKKTKEKVKEDGTVEVVYLGKFYNYKVSGSIKWKPYQTNPFPRDLLEKYNGNVGVVLGKYESGYKPSSKKAKDQLKLFFTEDELEEDVVDYREYYLVQVDIDNPDHYQYFKDVDSFTVQSGRGYHIYLKSLEPIRTKPDYPIPGIEVRCTGGLCPIPPSIHPKTGKPYQTIKDVPILEVDNAYQFTTDLIPEELNPRSPQEFEYKDTTKKKHKFKYGEDRNLPPEVVKQIITIFNGIYTPATNTSLGRDHIVFCLSGWLRKAGITQESAVVIVKALATAYEDEEIDSRLNVCNRTYEEVDVEKTLGSKCIKEIMVTKDPKDGEDKYLMLELILDGSKPWQDPEQVEYVKEVYK